jgi:hypothetical protein
MAEIRADEKEVVNADEYAAMRRELVVMRKMLAKFTNVLCACVVCREEARVALESCPIAAELSKQDGGNV